MPKRNPHPWLAILALTLPATSTTGFAQEAVEAWPSKPITLVRTNNPGGSNEDEMRLWTDKLAVNLGKPFIIDHKAGASGSIGAAYVAKASPDGYTFLVATSSFTVVPAFNAKLSYDVVKDFAAVSMLTNQQIVLIAGAGFPASNFQEYIAYARANPGKIFWATSGVGTANHLSGELMQREIKASVTYVQYKGGGPSVMFPDLLAGRVHVYPASVQNALPNIKAGKFKPIVMLSSIRSAALPDVRTAIEQGYPEIEQPNYQGVLAPAGTNPRIIQRLSAEFARISKHPDMAKLEAEGNTIMVSTPAEFGKFIAIQVNRWIRLVKELNIKAE